MPIHITSAGRDPRDVGPRDKKIAGTASTNTTRALPRADPFVTGGPLSAVAGVHQILRGLHDSPQHEGEVQLAHDGAVGAEQPAQPMLGLEDLTGAID